MYIAGRSEQAATRAIAEIPASSNLQTRYTASKTANYLLASYFAAPLGPSSVLSVVQTPGNLQTSPLRHLPQVPSHVVAPRPYHARFGAYTNLWALFSPELTMQGGGARAPLASRDEIRS